VPVPTVSAVIPTYNRLPLLLAAVESVRAQTFGDWELIVADDGSTDGSAEAVEALRDPRIRVLRLPRTGYAAVARNAGVRAARGEWVAFLDSDDVWLPQKLEVQLGAVREAGAPWSYTGLALVDGRGSPVPFRTARAPALSGHILRALLADEAAATMSTLMVSRVLLDQVGGFDETLRMRADFDLVLRLAARAPVVAVPEVLTHLREHPARITAAAESPHALTCRVYERFLAREGDAELRRIARRRCAILLTDGAVHEARLGHRARAVRLLARSLRYRPPPLRWGRALASVGLRVLGRRDAALAERP
jgi:glycosyltransferase involved in cell wall biosynthesis